MLTIALYSESAFAGFGFSLRSDDIRNTIPGPAAPVINLTADNGATLLTSDDGATILNAN